MKVQAYEDADGQVWLAYEDPRVDTGNPASPEWWKGAFADPVLDQLIDLAVTDSLSLRSAGLRVLQARQQLAIAIGNQYPQQQTVSGSAEKFRENDRTDEFYDLGFSVTWEADVWGRFRRQIESAEAQLDARCRELLEVLRRLNEEQGVTIVTATHDPMVMEYARRQVRLRDGQIVEDSAAIAA